MKEYISASQIKTHKDCPKRYWFRYLSDIDIGETDTRYLDLGSAVHDSIETALLDWQDGMIAGPVEDPKEFSDWTAAVFLEEEAPHYDLPDDFIDNGETYCHRAAKFLRKNLPDQEVKDIERMVDYRIKSLDVVVRGKMDVATDTEIWDWKTGSIRDDTGLQETIQGALYMGAYRTMYGEIPKRIRFVYLKEEKIRNRDASSENWNEMLKYARLLLQAFQNGEWPAKPGDQCYWCEYEYVCPSSPASVEGIDWEEYLHA